MKKCIICGQECSEPSETDDIMPICFYCALSQELKNSDIESEDIELIVETIRQMKEKNNKTI